MHNKLMYTYLKNHSNMSATLFRWRFSSIEMFYAHNSGTFQFYGDIMYNAYWTAATIK